MAGFGEKSLFMHTPSSIFRKEHTKDGCEKNTRKTATKRTHERKTDIFSKLFLAEHYYKRITKEPHKGASQRSLIKELHKGASQRSLAKEPHKGAPQRSPTKEPHKGASQRSLTPEPQDWKHNEPSNRSLTYL